MKQNFTRTIKTMKTTIADGLKGFEPVGIITTDDTATMQEILTKARETFPNVGVHVVVDSVIESVLYSCSLDDFLKIAKPVEK